MGGVGAEYVNVVRFFWEQRLSLRIAKKIGERYSGPLVAVVDEVLAILFHQK